MKRYLGLSEQEMSENETMWAEEQGDVEQAPSEDPNLRSVGISPGGIAGDLENVAPPPDQSMGMGAAPNQTQSMSPMGGAAPGAAAGASAMGTPGAI